jgi:hypothetical protein
MASDEKVETLTEAIRELNKTGREQVEFFKVVHETMRELIEILNEQPLQPEGEIIRDDAGSSFKILEGEHIRLVEVNIDPRYCVVVDRKVS